MAKIGNCAGAMVYRIYWLYGANPDFETVDQNLKIEISFGEVPEETLFRNRELLLGANGMIYKWLGGGSDVKKNPLKLR